MDNYITSFRLLNQLGVSNIRATGVINRNRSCEYTITGDKQLQKKGTWPLWIAHIKQKNCNFD